MAYLQTNTEYTKRSMLTVDSSVGFQLNLGDTLDTEVDVTRQIKNLGKLKEKLTKSSLASGGVLLPKLKIKLDNKFGDWNRDLGYFKNGFINNSVFNIETFYKQWLPESNTYSNVTPSLKFSGVIKSINCSWDRDRLIFETVLVPGTNIIASEKIQPGTLSNNTFKNLIYIILNRTPFTKYLTIDLNNINLGWDVSSSDSIADMTNDKVKNVLDEIMLLTGSIYYVNYDNEFIVEPVIPVSPSATWTIRGHDIIKILSEDYYWKGHYTAIQWDDNENTVQNVEMTFTDRQLYQYDFNRLKLTSKYINDSAKRTTIMTNLLNMHKFLKRKVKLTCKWNPDIIVNAYVALDVPQESIIGDDYMTWNQDNWNEGKFWGLDSPGISFNSNNLWRVLDIDKSLEGDQMTLTLQQLYSDDEL